jgi:hypothetical protein
MNFKEIVEKFESLIGEQGKFELLENNYTAYAFGSGFAAYKMNRKILKLIFDGRDGEITLLISPKNGRYPLNDYKTIFIGKDQTLFADTAFLEQEIHK